MDFSSAEQGLEKSEAVGTQAASSGVCTAQLFANSAMSSVCSPTAWKEHPEKRLSTQSQKVSWKFLKVLKYIHYFRYRYVQSNGSVGKKKKRFF